MITNRKTMAAAVARFALAILLPVLFALPALAGGAFECVDLKPKIVDYEYFKSYCSEPRHVTRPECVNSDRERNGKAALDRWNAAKCDVNFPKQKKKRCLQWDKDINEWARWAEQCRYNTAQLPPGITFPDIDKKMKSGWKEAEELGCFQPD